MLTIQGMCIQRGNQQQSFAVSLPALSLQAGEIAALTGPSGCGKSTLLEMIGLILQPNALELYQLGREQNDITQDILTDNQRALAGLRAQKLGFVLQNGGLLPYLTVWQNIQLPRQMLGLPAKSTWLEKAISHLQLIPLLHHYPRQLSIGERQRVAFVRAIAHEPALLLADEPTAALDPHNAQILFSLIVEMVKSLQLSALIVSHDWSLVEQFQLKRYQAELAGGGSVFLNQ